MLRSGQLTYGEIRDRQTGQLQVLTYAALLWQWFRALIEGALDSLSRELVLLCYVWTPCFSAA